MIRRAPALFALLLAAAAPAAAQVAAGSAGGSGAGGRSPAVTAPELQSHVETLAADALAGRRAGTPGAERAALYIVRRFQEAGLAAPADHPTYLQTFEFPVGVELGPENRLVLQNGSRLSTIFTPGLDYLPLSGSLADRVVQPVVFAGYGISAPWIGYDDYAGIDVRGKVVLVLRLSPEGDDPGGRFGRYLSERAKAATARAKGAKAILFVNPPATEEIDRLIPFTLDQPPGALGIVALSVTQSVARRIAATGNQDLSLLQHAIDREGKPRSLDLGDAVLNLRVDVRPRRRTTHNVIGIVPGRDAVRAAAGFHEAVVVGAHYDGLGLGGPGSLDPVPGEIHNGADDNASGVAALLELAQHFAAPQNRPRRTIVFVAFGAEEVGMLGSARFVAHPPVPIRDVVAMVNMDMIGRLRDELVVYGVGSSPAWEGILAEANAPLGLPVRTEPDAYGPSDHAAFFLRRVPVLSFFTGVHEDYHRSTDDPGRIDPAGLESVTRLVRNVVAAVAERADRPAFDGTAAPRPIPPETARPAGGARIGAVPAPGLEGGVVVDHVLEGSPAEEAGIRAGDRIHAVAGQRLADVYAYDQVLGMLVPGEEVRVVIEREGVRMTVTLVPIPAPGPIVPDLAPGAASPAPEPAPEGEPR